MSGIKDGGRGCRGQLQGKLNSVRMTLRGAPVMQVSTALLLVVALLSTNSEGREFRNRRQFSVRGGEDGGASSSITSKSAVSVPDAGKIDSELLKAVAADKFLSLWFIFVLGGPSQNTG